MSQQPGLDYRFDTRVAVQYDALRGHPPAVAPIIGQAITAHAGAHARVLELGVGTGRIALPVAGAGCEVFGVDLSAHMLAALAQRVAAEGHGRVHLVQGDITALPFRDRSFDAAMAVHVLHLVADWQGVLARVKSLVRPGGVLILGRDWVDPDSFAGMIRNFFRQTVVEVGTQMMPPGSTAAQPPSGGASGGAAIVQTLMGLGAQPQGRGELVGAEWQTELTPQQVLEGIGSRDDAESWVLPDDVLGETMRRLDAFALGHWPDLAEPQTVTRRFLMGVFRFPD
jgi:ubiquinone/menaquinone biosynthesis C-methylase UbiE